MTCNVFGGTLNLPQFNSIPILKGLTMLLVTLTTRSQNFEDEKFFRHENLVYNVTAGPLRIMKSIFLHPEVPENSKSGPFSRIVILILP